MVRPAPRPSPATGFTLVELLLIGAVTAALLGGGAASLLRHQRASHAALLNAHNNAELLRTRQQLQQEIALAERLAAGAQNLPAGCPALVNPLVLVGPGNGWRIAYGLRRQGPDDDWRGPAQLLRCGPPYGPTGLNPAAAPLNSVVLDRLSAGDGGFRTSINGTGVTISLQPYSSSAAIPTSTINARFAGQGLAGASARFGQCSGLCEESDSTNHWRPAGGTIAGDATKTDILHFPFDRASYELSDPCDRSICTVSGTPTAVVYNGDLLVFSDLEMRLR
jgi:hypothetical protein